MTPRGGHDVAFVFPAGGSAGATQVGIARALLDAGIVPDVVVGCSVGALNATFLALDPSRDRVDALRDIWMRIDRADVFGTSRTKTLLRLAQRCDHLYDADPLRTLIRRFCGVSDLSETSIPVHVVTTDLDNSAARWWTTGPTEEVLYASACLPGLFPPVLIGNSRHVDGGVLDPVPVQRAVDTDARTVYVLGDADGPGPPPSRSMSALEVLLRSFAIKRYGNLPDPERLARPGQQVIVVPGADTTHLDIRNFSETRRLVHESELLAAGFLASTRPERRSIDRQSCLGAASRFSRTPTTEPSGAWPVSPRVNPS